MRAPRTVSTHEQIGRASTRPARSALPALRQRKSYVEVAELLQISAQAVHDRAHVALAMLAPAQARELSSQERLEVGDYLLGQQTGIAERLKTRTLPQQLRERS